MEATQATERTRRESVVVRFVGDSGDGMQITGAQFALTTAWHQHNLRTLPDYPAEIRAPAGSTYGVSSYQIHFGSDRVLAGGDKPDVLVVMNPAALKVHLPDMEPGGLIIVDTGSFKPRNLRRAGYEANPLEDGSLSGFQKLEVDISRMAVEAVRDFELTHAEAHRTKNMWSLGLMCWMYGHSRARIADWLEKKFAKRRVLAESNIAALNAGYAFGDIAEIDRTLPRYDVAQARFTPGTYRAITGAEALGIGLIAGARLAALRLMFASYPITPASPLLHFMSAEKRFGVITFQAEDEIAAICAAIGASYAGSLGVTSSSGPGIALKTEALGLAITCELPLIVVNSQRGGPSTGLPTKTEQADLLQAVHGRNGDAPLVVLAPSTPSDCFTTAIEAVRIATKYMTPVMILSDGLLANASEPWALPKSRDFEPFPVALHTEPEGYMPFQRNPTTLARPWAVPGTPGLEHRIGGLEKRQDTGEISYDGENHQRMTDLRRAKVAGVVRDIPDQKIAAGPDRGRLVVVSWGSPYGRVRQTVERLNHEEGLGVAHVHLRHLCPFPANLGELLARFEKVLVVEMNTGQLRSLLRAEYCVDACGFNRVTGRPFQTSEIAAAIRDARRN